MKDWRLRMSEGTTLVYKLPKQRRYAYYDVTRKSVHRTRMPPPKCHSETRHGLLYGTKSRADNSKTKSAGVVFLVYDTSTQCDACICKVL